MLLSTLKLYNLFKNKLQVITVVIKDFEIRVQIADSEHLSGQFIQLQIWLLPSCLDMVSEPVQQFFPLGIWSNFAPEQCTRIDFQ